MTNEPICDKCWQRVYGVHVVESSTVDGKVQFKLLCHKCFYESKQKVVWRDYRGWRRFISGVDYTENNI